MKKKVVIWLWIFMSLAIYGLIAYVFSRNDEIGLQIAFGGVFLLYFLSVFVFKKNKLTVNLSWLFAIGLLFRMIFIVSFPKLSDDYFRFVWDGHIILKGENPYHYKPQDYPIENDKWSTHLLTADSKNFPDGMNSSHYYSVYPPLNQFFFATAVFFGGKSVFGSVIALRVLLLICEIGLFIVFCKIIDFYKKNKAIILLYWFNPLVIVEITGNLHFEGVTLLLLGICLLMALSKRVIVAGIFMGLAASVKLTPLLLIPLFFRELKWQKTMLLGGVSILIFGLLFLPYFSKAIVENYLESMSLFVARFEFNASIYYLIRELGFWVSGNNIINSTSKVLPLVFFGALFFMSTTNRGMSGDLWSKILFALTALFLLSTTVHPWYIIYLLPFAMLSNFNYPLVWSFTSLWSYWAYRNPDFVTENMIIITLEYIFVLSALIIEFKPQIYIQLRDKIRLLF